jgi:hypothetical protein
MSLGDRAVYQTPRLARLEPTLADQPDTQPASRSFNSPDICVGGCVEGCVEGWITSNDGPQSAGSKRQQSRNE